MKSLLVAAMLALALSAFTNNAKATDHRQKIYHRAPPPAYTHHHHHWWAPMVIGTGAAIITYKVMESREPPPPQVIVVRDPTPPTARWETETPPCPSGFQCRITINNSYPIREIWDPYRGIWVRF